MRVELHDHLGDTTTSLQANRVVIYDHFDNPIAVVMQLADGRYTVATAAAGDAFLNTLKRLGITKTLVIDKLKAK